MNTLTRITLITSILALPCLMEAHSPSDNGVTYLAENRHPKERALLEIPNINGYETLKCDLHMHTVFSDGLVWPTIRVQEAWQEGLDAICITDHLEYQPHKDDVPTNFNRSYELAVDAAKDNNILLLRGSELTRDTPPGHFNAVFIKDADPLYVPKEKGNLKPDRQAIENANDQGAFIFWNHPGWRVNSIEGSYDWIPFVDEVWKDGFLHGIEVINGFSFHRKALDWALQHDLTIMGSSDVHNLIAHDYYMERGVHRSMTLVFARDRSMEGLREALDAGRTVAWSTKLIAGREKWIRALFDASVKIGESFSVDRNGNALYEITNTSDLYFELERIDSVKDGWSETISLNPRSSQVLKVKPDPEVKTTRYSVTNAYIGGDRNLIVEIGH